VHAAFLTSLGLYFSVISRTILGAYAKMALSLLGIAGFTTLWGIALNLPEGHWANDLVEIGLNPVRTWLALGFTYRDFAGADRLFLNSFGASLAGIGFYALMALLFWVLACRAFRRERYRHVE
jgi:hypothetical protein